MQYSFVFPFYKTSFGIPLLLQKEGERIKKGKRIARYETDLKWATDNGRHIHKTTNIYYRLRISSDLQW